MDGAQTRDESTVRLAELLTIAEEANRRANSEAGYAFNAKQAAEEHAKAVAQIKGSIEADVAWLAATKERVEEAARAINESKTQSQLQATSVQEAEQQAKQSAQQAADASKRASDIAPEMEALRDRGKGALVALTDAQTAAERARAAAADAEKGAAESFEAAKAHSNTAVQARELAAAAQQQAEEHAATLKALADKATESLASVQAYEARLKAHADGFDAVQKKIEGLLPNATSAGLASAFRNQKDRFTVPQIGWLVAFFVALVGVVAAAFIGLPPSSGTWDAILRHFVNRLPLAAPLVWMAIYSARHYGMAVRVQEEYAFKEALSTAFEGYKREMDTIRQTSSESPADAPLLVLCQNVLMALSERPGRIYEGRQQDITPLASAVESLKELVAQAKDAIRPGTGKP